MVLHLAAALVLRLLAPQWVLAVTCSVYILQIVFLPGGHGIVFDGPGNKKLATVLSEAYAAGMFAPSRVACACACVLSQHSYQCRCMPVDITSNLLRKSSRNATIKLCLTAVLSFNICAWSGVGLQALAAHT